MQGKTIAFLVANEGVEQVELTEPWRAVEEAWGRPLLVSSRKPDDLPAFCPRMVEELAEGAYRR